MLRQLQDLFVCNITNATPKIADRCPIYLSLVTVSELQAMADFKLGRLEACHDKSLSLSLEPSRSGTSPAEAAFNRAAATQTSEWVCMIQPLVRNEVRFVEYVLLTGSMTGTLLVGIFCEICTMSRWDLRLTHREPSQHIFVWPGHVPVRSILPDE